MQGVFFSIVSTFMMNLHQIVCKVLFRPDFDIVSYTAHILDVKVGQKKKLRAAGYLDFF